MWQAQGDMDAFPEMSRVAESSRSLGTNHPTYLKALHYLGQWFLDSDELSRAEILIFEAWNGRRKTLGHNHPDTLASFFGVVLWFVIKLEVTQALKLCHEYDVLKSFAWVYGLDHSWTEEASCLVATLESPQDFDAEKEKMLGFLKHLRFSY
ncbi:expressed unknown protein [Seminavis robusta]|uniref:Uncharacterized protein n=1 Tax=Seminavis robusta TaxID=568900 RepID=A0A9N8DZA8_9STRA|nr:expressed unknown protein [Seminavis robusta]|eukprot:Sro395_g133990.1 n/a (152) ;mRNA; f:13383-13838